MAKTSSIKVKICGVTSFEAVEAVIENSADFAGFVFYERSPRNVTPEKAAPLINRLPDTIPAVGLFVDADDAQIDAVLKQARLDILQLHGNETPQRVAALKARHGLPVIKAIKIAAAEDLIMLGPFQAVADWILFDAKAHERTALPGGNGQVFDWQLLKNLKITKPWMLSGGLSTGNINEALSALKPDAVDVSSGVEDSPGVKNPDKIREFIEIVKAS